MRKVILLLLIPVLIAGCGYTAGSLLPTYIKSVYIQPFRNKIELTEELPDQYRFRTYRAHLETDITKEVIDKFINDGHLKVAKEGNADVILSGELIDYLRQPVRYDPADNETVEEYRISIVCSVILKDVRKDQIMWQESRIIGDATYILRGRFATSESSAVSAAVSDLARRIVNRTIEGW